jgi:hypothetical protein
MSSCAHYFKIKPAQPTQNTFKVYAWGWQFEVKKKR